MDGQQFTALANIRDVGPYSSRSTSGGALLDEAFLVFTSIRHGMSAPEARQAVLRGEILRKASFETRRQAVNLLTHRYLSTNDWVIGSLARATNAGATSPAFVSLAYLYHALRDRLTFEFVVGPIWDKWRNRSTTVAQADLLSFIDERAGNGTCVKKWRESTRAKVAQSTLVALKGFRLLHGAYTKQIQKPTISPETTFHLLCVLLAEGHEGRSIVEAPDWRLFLWSEPEVAHALGDLAQKRWIRFEKSGRTAMLELLRKPEIDI